ncbi:MAG: DNA polymerase III subunit alpha, partial [Chitinophagaceae bacterium]|nr:DNA polymerase III subunit alpha [Chitinophagaceae bacterium]
NALAKLVPERPGVKLHRLLHAPISALDGEKSIQEAEAFGGDFIDNIKKLREIYNSNSLQSEVLHVAEKLEGSVRNTGIHAAGVIIAPQDLSELIPVFTSKETHLCITQIEGSIIEDSGVLKMDFLGLRTLTIIKNALELIKQNHGVEIDIDSIPLDDEKTYRLYQRADTIGTFQFESHGMQKYLKELKPDSFNDLIAMNALYRPGPMQYIPRYIDRKHGREMVSYDLPEMEEILKDTYGITVYQEQVMLLAQKLANFSKGDADVLRKAMGKKDRKILDKMKSKFIDGAVANGHPREKLEKIWSDWESFAQYAFNKSHSTCYALVAYQTAYLKANYPAEYMAAVLNSAGNVEKITFFMEECQHMGIKVLGPDINESQKGFAVNKAGEIRFGLGGLKGVGEAAVESIIEERQRNGMFADIFDFIKRINQRTVNKKTLESLVYAGAFDCFKNLHRAQYFCIPEGETISGLEKIIRYGNIIHSDSIISTNTLFGNLPMALDVKPPQIQNCPPWPLTVQLEHEKDVTGMFLSGHPLDHYKFEMKHYGITPIQEFNEIKEVVSPQTNGKTYKLLCLVSDAKHKISKAGNKYGAFTVEDYSGKTEIMLWGDDYVRFGPFFQQSQALFISGCFKQRYSTSEPEFRITNVTLAENLKIQLTKKLCLELDPRNVEKETIDFLEKNLKKYPGKAELKVTVNEPKNKLKVDFITMNNGFEMNNEMIEFLHDKPEIDVHIAIN